MEKEKTMDYTNEKYYENRELSWLKFNHRVLSEARDKSIPLLERTKFVSITSSNLDEFFMVRVASLKDMVHAKYKKTDLAGMTATQQLEEINKATRQLVELQYSTFNRSQQPQLRAQGIYVYEDMDSLSDTQKAAAQQYFEEIVYPVLTPMAVDASRPFPLIRNKSLNIGALIQKEEERVFATVQVPSVLPRLVPLPTDQPGEYAFLLLEQLIIAHIDKLFSN